MELDSQSEIYSLAVTRDGTKIISSEESGMIKVWDVESHELVKEWTHPEGGAEIAISPDDRLISVGVWSVAIYSMEGRQVGHSIEAQVDDGDWLSSMTFSPDGKKLACATHDTANIRVYDVDSGTLILGPLRGHHRVRVVLWSRDGSRIFSSGDNTIRCWNSDTGKQTGHPHHRYNKYLINPL